MDFARPLELFQTVFRRKVPCMNMTDKKIEDLFRQMQEMWLVQGKLQQTLQAQLELQQHLQMNLVGMQMQHHQLQLQHQQTLGVITELHELLKSQMGTSVAKQTSQEGSPKNRQLGEKNIHGPKSDAEDCSVTSQEELDAIEAEAKALLAIMREKEFLQKLKEKVHDKNYISVPALGLGPFTLFENLRRKVFKILDKTFKEDDAMYRYDTILPEATIEAYEIFKECSWKDCISIFIERSKKCEIKIV